MTSLTARFREVEVMVDSPPLVPLDRPWPAHWLRPETAPALVRFVETHFDPERTPAEIRGVFGEVRNITAHPMPLRAIFVTLARDACARGRRRPKGESRCIRLCTFSRKTFVT